MRPIRAQERASFTAMGPLADQAPSIYAGWKRYVYQGTGEDQHPTWDLEYVDPEAERRAAVRAAYARAEKVRKAKRNLARLKREMRSFAAEVRATVEPEPEYPPLKLVWSQAEVAEDPEPEPFTVKRGGVRLDKPRPSPGWKPVTGEDIDHLLGDE